MDVIIETNLFYYWSKLETSDYKPEKIDSNLKQFDNIYLSELTLLELIVHYRKNKNKIFDAFNFIAEKHIGILPYLSKDKTLLIKDLNQLMRYDWFFDYFVQNTFENKIDIEANFFVFWLASIVGIFAVILFTKTPFDSSSKSENFFRQFYALIMSMHDKKGYLYEQIHLYLEEFYLSEDDVKLKDNIVDLI